MRRLAISLGRSPGSRKAGGPACTPCALHAAGSPARAPRGGTRVALSIIASRRGLDKEDLMKDSRKVDLVSMYMRQPVLGGHGISLQLAESRPGQMTGRARIDPNVCSLDLWGDRRACTKMGFLDREVQATLMRTYDPQGHKRAHWALTIKGVLDAKVSLIEYPGPHLWYLSVSTPQEGTVVVPLFDAKLFALRAAEAVQPHEEVAGEA
jgi:hypothetical protein